MVLSEVERGFGGTILAWDRSQSDWFQSSIGKATLPEVNPN